MLRIVFVVIRLILFIPAWLLFQIPNQKNKSFDERASYVLKKLKQINKAARIDIVATGIENVPIDQGCLITPNHQGLEDIIAIALSLNKPIKGIAKIELKKIPLVRHIFDLLDCYYMDRDDFRASMKIIANASKDVEQGHRVVVFPEGTRSKKGNELLEFKGGTFKIATKVQGVIVPVAIRDSYKVFDVNSIKKTTVYVDYLKPIYYEEYNTLSTNDIALLVQTRIEEHIKASTL